MSSNYYSHFTIAKKINFLIFEQCDIIIFTNIVKSFPSNSKLNLNLNKKYKLLLLICEV